MTPVNYPFKIKQIPHNRKLGKISREFGRKTNDDEDAAADILANFGHDIRFLLDTNVPGIHTPDCIWNKQFWEIKTLYGNSYENTSGAVSSALPQSHNIIINTCRTKRSLQRVAIDVSGYLRKTPGVKDVVVLVISRDYYCKIAASEL